MDETAARRLVCAIVLQALRDKCAGDEAAREWLQSDMVCWLDAAGLDFIGPREVAAALEHSGPLNTRQGFCNQNR